MTVDVLRSLVLAVNLLRVTRICVVQHTDCAIVGSTEDEVKTRIEGSCGTYPGSWDFLTSTDQLATLRADTDLIRACGLLPPGIPVAGFVLDVHSGELIDPFR